MKAMVFHQYGSIEALKLEEVAKPVPAEGQVLVKVRASSVNDWDWGLLRGKPFINRLAFGLFKPKITILGVDVAGVVEAVGGQASRFQPGDAVFGDLSGCGFGGFGEYVCAKESALTLKPAQMSFEQAAALPHAGLLAWQGLFGKRPIRAGQKVLINGAGGGAGTVAIQMAKAAGAEVTGVDSGPKLALMKKMGADRVVDYTREDFTQDGERYDRILDCSAHRSLFDYRRALKPDGRYIMMGGASGYIIQTMLLGPWLSLLGRKKMGPLMHVPNRGMDQLIRLFEAGHATPVIGKTYPLEQLPAAFQFFGGGQHQGKLIITM